MNYWSDITMAYKLLKGIEITQSFKTHLLITITEKTVSTVFNVGIMYIFIK